MLLRSAAFIMKKPAFTIYR